MSLNWYERCQILWRGWVEGWVKGMGLENVIELCFNLLLLCEIMYNIFKCIRVLVCGCVGRCVGTECVRVLVCGCVGRWVGTECVRVLVCGCVGRWVGTECVRVLVCGRMGRWVGTEWIRFTVGQCCSMFL